MDQQCDLARNDGELLVFDCNAWPRGPNGEVYTGLSEAMVFQRTEKSFQRVRVPALLPGAGADPRLALGAQCTFMGIEGLSLEFPGNQHEPWLNNVQPLAVLRVSIGSTYYPSYLCEVEYSALATEIGCGPLSHLAYPALRSFNALETAILPLSFTTTYTSRDGSEHHPKFTSFGAHGRAAAEKVNASIAEFLAMPKSDRQCAVELSDSDVVSVACGNATRNVTVRLADATPVTIEQVLGGRPDALGVLTKKCLSVQLRPPQSDDDIVLKAFPRLTPDAIHFTLRPNEIDFLIQHEGTSRKEPKVATASACRLPYSDLGLTLKGLVARKPKGAGASP